MTIKNGTDRLEALAKKLDGDKETDSPISLSWNERRLAATALRYLAEHIADEEGKRRRGNPNFKPKFNHSWAATYCDILLSQGMSKTDAYITIAEIINAELPQKDGVTETAVQMAVNKYRKKVDG